MPRAKRVVAVGAPHHVTQRGNARQDVFVNDGLRRVYLDLLAEHAGKNSLRVAAYCLMTNHVHLVVVPESVRSLANTFRHAHAPLLAVLEHGVPSDWTFVAEPVLLLSGGRSGGVARDPVRRTESGSGGDCGDGDGVCVIERAGARRAGIVAVIGLRLVEAAVDGGVVGGGAEGSR